ncbi:uncharacterized protein LOC129723841 [Wyeomyia smithii]|uniref:uncharacterized protein LOC129723841 n=1 Tax=Wyeomyia smithii TaxID=174621 RepID=UPI002467F233|nr:uncharacterized protein LOC129723841 [Wyeomyia smithii]
MTRQLQFLNAFNYLLVCNVRFDGIRNEVVLVGKQGNSIVVLILLCAIVYFVIKLEQITSMGVESVTSITRYTITFITIFIIKIEDLFRRKSQLNLCQLMKVYTIHVDKGFSQNKKVGEQTTLLLIKLQIVLILVLDWMLNGYYIYEYWNDPSMTYIIVLLFEEYVQANLVFTQFFAYFLSTEFQRLKLQIGNQEIQKLLGSAEKLEQIKRVLSDVFGSRLLLFLFQLLVNVSCCCYELMAVFKQQHLSGALIGELSYVMFKILTCNALVLFGTAYSFDRVDVEEEELRNKLKTLQYNACEDQSEKYSNFLDIVNLKLITDSPKITACGLFTINLKVFCNIFTAIVTYIMILFQFRDLEKH